jgi:hypothetical protein
VPFADWVAAGSDAVEKDQCLNSGGSRRGGQPLFFCLQIRPVVIAVSFAFIQPMVELLSCRRRSNVCSSKRSMGLLRGATASLAIFVSLPAPAQNILVNPAFESPTDNNRSITDQWDQGDFNFAGTLNASDFALLAENFGVQTNAHPSRFRLRIGPRSTPSQP